jgi:hypothetical protein
MSDMQIVATAVVYLGAAQSCALMAGWLADRPDAVHRSWADGVAWYRTRRAQVARLSRTWLLAVLRAALPAHGKRRAGVA